MKVFISGDTADNRLVSLVEDLGHKVILPLEKTITDFLLEVKINKEAEMSVSKERL